MSSLAALCHSWCQLLFLKSMSQPCPLSQYTATSPLQKVAFASSPKGAVWFSCLIFDGGTFWFFGGDFFGGFCSLGGIFLWFLLFFFLVWGLLVFWFYGCFWFFAGLFFLILVILGHLVITIFIHFPLTYDFFSLCNRGQMLICRWHQPFHTVCPIPLFWLNSLATFFCLTSDKWGLEWNGNELRSEFMGLQGTIC